MKVELDTSQLDEASKKKIQQLEKEVKSLKKKVESRDRTISRLKELEKATKDRREKIRNLSSALAEELEDNNWIDLDREFGFY